MPTLIAIITVTHGLRRRRPMIASARHSAGASCATAISTITRIISIGLAALVITSAPACKDDAPPGNAPGAQPAPSAHERGRQNAAAMVHNANRCEGSNGASDLSACETACGLNHSNSCANWGQLLADHDPERARLLFERACRGGSGIGCELRARLAAREKQSDADERFAIARDYHRVHCSQGYARSCAQLAGLYQEGLGGERNAEATREFERRACALGWQEACLKE